MSVNRPALLICDNEDSANPVLNAFEQDYVLWHVARQRDAIAYLKAHYPALVIIDLDMPGLDVTELMQATGIRNNDKARPVLLGFSRRPDRLADSIAAHFDKIIGI